MLNNLRIQNFKAWKDTEDIHLAPITLFFGANNSGKSSIGQFLMMLKQTTDSPDRKAVFNTGSRDSAVKLGTFQEMVYRRDPSLRIGFAYSWNLPDVGIQINDPTDEAAYFCNELSFEAEVGLSDQANEALVAYRFNYNINQTGKRLFSISYTRKDRQENEYAVDAIGYSLKRNEARTRQLKDPDRFYGFPDEVVAGYQNASFVRDLAFENDVLFRYMYYLGPLRERPERIYDWNGIDPDSVGYSGENAIAVLLAAEGRKISLKSSEGAPQSIAQVIRQKLAEMGLAEEISANRIVDRQGQYEVKVQTSDSSLAVDLPDVGIGVSQVLPVIIQGFCATFDSIIIMEQPELHLHPRAQSALADVLIDIVMSQENGVPRNIQLIIETHSEHFLRRLQRRIAEDKLPKEMVAAYFAEMSNGEAHLNELQIDEYGNIRNWPKDFFGDDDNNDIMEHSLAAINKRIALKANGHKTTNE